MFWNIKKGNSRARVSAPDYAGAVARGAEIGFRSPESVVLETVPGPDITLTLMVGGPHADHWRVSIGTPKGRTFCASDYWACADYIPHKEAGGVAERASASGLRVRCD